MHVVATGEDMPLTEASQIIERLRGELGLPVGELFVNRCRPISPAGAGQAVQRLEHARLASDHLPPGVSRDTLRRGLILAAGRALAWEAIQERGIDGIEQSSGLEAFRLPLLASEEFGRAEVEKLAVIIAERDAGRCS